MVGEVHRRGFVGGRLVLDPHGVVFRERVANDDRQISGEALIAVGADHGEIDAGAIVAMLLGGFPEDAVDAGRSAMECVGAVVDRQAVTRAVDGKFAAGDAVGESPDGAAKVSGVAQIGIQTIEAEHHVGETLVPIGSVQLGDACAIISELEHRPRRVGEREQLGDFSLGTATDFTADDCHGGDYTGRRGEPRRKREGELGIEN